MMTAEELNKTNNKARLKAKNGMDFSEEFATVLEECMKAGCFDDIKPYEPKTSIPFVGSVEEKIKFFRDRLETAYKSLDKVYENNSEEQIEALFTALNDLSDTYWEITDGKVDPETDEPFFTEHEVISDMEWEYMSTLKPNPEYPPIIFDHIYKFVPWILEKVDSGATPEFMTDVMFIMGGTVSCYAMHTTGIFGDSVDEKGVKLDIK